MPLQTWKLGEDTVPSREAWRAFVEAFDARPLDVDDSENAEIEAALSSWPEHLREVDLYSSADESDLRDCRESSSLRFARSLHVNAGDRWPSFLEDEPERFAHIRRVTIADQYAYHENADFLGAMSGVEAIAIISPTLIDTLDVLGTLPSLAHLALTDYMSISADQGGLDWLESASALETLILFDNILESGTGWRMADSTLARVQKLWLPLEVLLAHPAGSASALSDITTQVSSEEEMEELVAWIEQMNRPPTSLSVLTNKRHSSQFPSPEGGWGEAVPEGTSVELLASSDFTRLWSTKVRCLGDSKRG